MSNDVKEIGGNSKDTGLQRRTTNCNGAEIISAVEASLELGLVGMRMEGRRAGHYYKETYA